tara:strand:+ start:2570 stop:5104 length:2535 start_codon:yes stop_codon:yes gene_type:complete
MAINLKEILVSDVDNIKLDKVNYNFDQLVANGGGPQGFQGSPGDIGYQGVTGYQGNQGVGGYQGFKGDQGSNGQEIWKVNPGNGSQSDTILPITNAQGIAPSVIIGYKTTDIEYNNYNEERAQVVINRHSNFTNNLELKTVGLDTVFAFKLDTDILSGNALMNMSFINGTGSINKYADVFTWGDPTLVAGNLISLNETLFNVKVDTVFQKDVKINGELRILNGNPQVDRIAVSENAQGKIIFKDISDIGGTVPIGTIISMLPAYFEDNNKFVNQHTAISPNTAPIDIYVGRGIGEYDGWYICNGKVWSNGTNTFITPDLNSFSYNIENDPNMNNPDSQGEAILIEDEIPIIGGADTSLTATYNNSTLLFDVTGALGSTETIFQSDSGNSGTSYIIKKLPQIIYLGFNNLTWSDNGTGAGNVPPTYTFLNWTGIGGGATVQQGGVVNVSLGSESSQYYVPPQSITIVPVTFSANTSNSSIQRTISTTIIVPSGFSNTGQTVNGTLNANQPTNYNPGPFTTTLTASPDSNQGNTYYDQPLPVITTSYTANEGSTSGNINLNMSINGDYYRTGGSTPGIIFNSVAGTGASEPTFALEFRTNTTGYQLIQIGEIWRTNLTIGTLNLNPTIEYEFINTSFLNRDNLLFKTSTPNVDWNTTYETNVTPTGSLNSTYSFELTNRFRCIGLPYREVTVRTRTAYTGSGSTPLETATYSLSELTSTNVGASIHNTVHSIDAGGDHICDITIRTGLGSGTFDIETDIPVSSNGGNTPGCQSYKIYPHLTSTTTIVNYKICGGSTTQVSVAPEETLYICAEIGAMGGGVDYVIVQGNSNTVTIDNNSTNNCITQI